MHPFVYVIMMVANALAPKRRQAISNHHADLTVTAVSYEYSQKHVFLVTRIKQ